MIVLQALQGKRTYAVAFAVFLAAAAEKLDVVKLLDDPKAVLTAMGMAGLMAFMRWFTEQTTVKAALNAPPPNQQADGQ